MAGCVQCECVACMCRLRRCQKVSWGYHCAGRMQICPAQALCDSGTMRRCSCADSFHMKEHVRAHGSLRSIYLCVCNCARGRQGVERTVVVDVAQETVLRVAWLDRDTVCCSGGLGVMFVQGPGDGWASQIAAGCFVLSGLPTFAQQLPWLAGITSSR